MTSRRVVAIFLILAALTSAFNIEETFYPSENVTVSYENFTLDGKEYSIVSFDGTEVFLLEDGEPVTDSSDIDSVISSYFLQQFYPSDEEVEEIRDLLDIYNKSRNDGQKFPGKEEYVCREILFIDGRVKSGPDPIYCRGEEDAEEGCEYAALLMYQYLSAITGTPPVGSPEDLYDPIVEFGFASYENDEILADLDEKFDAAETDRAKMYSALEALEDYLPTLESNKDDIEDSLYTWTETKSCDSDHWCLCPDMEFNGSALEDLEEKADDLLDKMGPYEDYEGVAGRITNNSQERLDYLENESFAEQYSSEFEPLNETASEVISFAQDVNDNVYNLTFSKDLSRLKTLHETIPKDIEDRYFEDMESNLEEYEELIYDINETAHELYTYYNATKEAKNRANSFIVLLETKDLDPVSMEALDVLLNKTEDLDAEFREGLTVDELNELEEEYNAIADEAQDLLLSEKGAPATRILLLFRGFARNVNTGIANFAETTEIIEPEEIPQNNIYTLGLFSTLVFLSLASIALLIFLYIIATSNFSIPKTSHILASAFFSILILILGFSTFMYLFLGKTSTDATLPEFLADFNSKNYTYISVDLRNASYSDAVAMTECADSLSKTFEEQNKTWIVYHIAANTCTKMTSFTNSTMTVGECMEEMDTAESSFLLDYSATNEPPKFSIIYKNQAEIKANHDYYDSCPLVALFS